MSHKQSSMKIHSSREQNDCYFLHFSQCIALVVLSHISYVAINIVSMHRYLLFSASKTTYIHHNIIFILIHSAYFAYLYQTMQSVFIVGSYLYPIPANSSNIGTRI